ncbi:hypothetical protein E5288_WYG017351 [Bos mutus]|uniref:Uncharacterized protein n=1 Tax=Bos mutus TaxID=72004 RepID=A0A6B0RQJ4_9CETA|nr:hypothetical protein [Bos mutus]
MLESPGTSKRYNRRDTADEELAISRTSLSQGPGAERGCDYAEWGRERFSKFLLMSDFLHEQLISVPVTWTMSLTCSLNKEYDRTMYVLLKLYLTKFPGSSSCVPMPLLQSGVCSDEVSSLGWVTYLI